MSSMADYTPLTFPDLRLTCISHQLKGQTYVSVLRTDTLARPYGFGDTPSNKCYKVRNMGEIVDIKGMVWQFLISNACFYSPGNVIVIHSSFPSPRLQRTISLSQAPSAISRASASRGRESAVLPFSGERK